MKFRWAPEAVRYLRRLRAFLEPVAPRAADRARHALYTAAWQLSETPRLGRRLIQYDPREVRRVFVRDYEIRYELTRDALIVLRFWHMREDR